MKGESASSPYIFPSRVNMWLNLVVLLTVCRVLCYLATARQIGKIKNNLTESIGSGVVPLLGIQRL